MRTLIITACLSLVGSLVVAIALGSPLSLMLGLSTSAVIVVQIVERVSARRKQNVDAMDTRWAPDAHRVNPLTLVVQGSPVTWWSCELPAPTTRRVRLGTVVRGKRSRVVAADLTGGCLVSGPAPLAESVVLAVRLSTALEYAPYEPVPQVVTADPERVSRWRLDVTSAARGRLVDQLGQEPTIDDVEVDLVPVTFASVLTQWRSTSRFVEPHELNLEIDGPHTMVIGTTGSGKTEFLIALMAALTHAHSPQELAIAVFDFKGGGSFARLVGLPHLRHLVTDLEPIAVCSALDGLGALVRERERAMAAAGVSSLDQIDLAVRPPRVLIVVDEFQALTAQHVQAHAIFADIAARGRALGIHLVLATQRFAGSGLEALAANIAMRVCLRVTEATESNSVLGDARAASAQLVAGSGFVLRAGQPVVALRVRLTDRAHTFCPESDDALADSVKPLWLEPLREPPPAPRQTLGNARAKGFALGTLDDHDLMIRSTRSWHPRQGALLAAGDAGSRFELLDVLRSQGIEDVHVLASHGARAWDALFELAPAQRDALVIPSLDEIVATLPLAWRDEFLDELVRHGVELTARGAPVVVGIALNSGLRGRLSALAPMELQFGAGARPVDAVHAVFGGETIAMFRAERAGPGGVQNSAEPAPVPAVVLRESDVVITPHPRLWPSTPDSGDQSAPSVMTPDDWIFRVNRGEPVRIFLDGCTPADARALRLSPHPLPPPLAGTLIELRPDGTYRRVRASDTEL